MIAVILFFLLLYVNSLDTSAVVPLSYTEDGQHFTISFNVPSFNISGELLFHTNSTYTVIRHPSPYGLSLCNTLPSWVENQGIQITTDGACPEGSTNAQMEWLEITPDLIDSIYVDIVKFDCSGCCKYCVEHNLMGAGFIWEYEVKDVSHDPPLNPLASWERGFAGLPLLPDGDGNTIIEFNIADEPFLRWTYEASADEYQWTESRYHYHETIPNVFEVYDFSTCNTSLTGNHMKAVIDTSNVCLGLPIPAMETLSHLLDCNWEELYHWSFEWQTEHGSLGCYFESKPTELPVLTFSLTQNGPLFGIPLEDLYIDSSDKLCVIQTSSFNEDKILFGTMALRAFSGVAFDYNHTRVGFRTSDLFESVYSSGHCHEIPEASDLSCKSYILYDIDSDGKCIVKSTMVSTILGLTLTVFLLSFLNIGLRWLVEQNMTLTHA